MLSCKPKSRLTEVRHSRKTPVTIVETTDYPYSEEIRFAIDLSEPVLFPLRLRIPAWTSDVKVKINGQTQTLPSVRNGFISFKRAWRQGDLITLILAMSVTTSSWPENGVAVERGPLSDFLDV